MTNRNKQSRNKIKQKQKTEMDNIKYIILMFGVALMMTTMAGCVGSDLDDCPPGLNYSLVFQYLIHPKDPADLFTEDVQYISVYVFDATTGNCVYTETTPKSTWVKGSNNDYSMTLPLNAGDYNIITWGWGYEEPEYLDPEAYNIAPATPVERSVPVATTVTGDTRLNDPEVQLKIPIAANDTVIGRIERTFFGQKTSVNVPPMTSSSPSVKDTVKLLNISNRIRIVLENAKERGMAYNWKDIKISIVGSNQAYFFNPQEIGRSKSPGFTPPYADASTNNAPFFDPTNNAWPVIYKAYNKHYTDQILVEDQIVWRGSDLDSVLIADVSTMRMIAGDDNLAIRVEWEGLGSVADTKLLNIANTGDVNDDGLIVREFKKYYRSVYGVYPSNETIQNELDRNFEWIIFLQIPEYLGEETYLTGSVQVMDWGSVNQSSNPGGLLQ
jgi:hypothetical protein